MMVPFDEKIQEGLMNKERADRRERHEMTLKAQMSFAGFLRWFCEQHATNVRHIMWLVEFAGMVGIVMLLHYLNSLL